MVVRRTEDEVLLPAGLDDAPEVTYTPAPGPAWLAPPPTVNAELAELEALPALRSRWLDKVILLGTGTSGQVPAVQCMTHAAALSPAREVHHGDDRTYQSCRACHDVLLHGSLSRNRRTCTAAVVVGGPEHVESVSAPGQVGSPGAKRRPDQTTILIDCGPTFYEAACKAWAAHDLREIDAVLLTHGHADAVLGLDHLRAWTIGHAVQSHVDVYLSQTTYDVVSHMFPYLADPAKATGGGGVGQLRWHIIDPQEVFTVTPVDKRKTPVSVVPLPVHHGLAPGGDKFQFVGWRVGEMSYVSDCVRFPRWRVRSRCGVAWRCASGAATCCCSALSIVFLLADTLGAERDPCFDCGSHAGIGGARAGCAEMEPALVALLHRPSAAI